MFKFIIFVAIVGVAGYFLFQKMEEDKIQGKKISENIEIQDNSPAALKMIKNITK